jgi:hypothetical protein
LRQRTLRHKQRRKKCKANPLHRRPQKPA